MRRLQEPRAEQRHDRHRDEVRREQRQHDGQRQRREQEAADAVEKRHREEDDRAGQRRRQHGQRHFVAALLGRDLRRLAHLQVPEDVLEHDDRVVDQAREDQREPGEDHRVDRAAAHVERDERRQRRQRNRQEHRRPSRGSCRGRPASSARSAPGRCRLRRAASRSRASRTATGRTRPSASSCFGTSTQPADQVLDAVDDGDRVGVAALLHHRQVRPTAGRRPCTMLFWIWLRVLGVADVADGHRRPADGLERDPVDVGDRRGTGCS